MKRVILALVFPGLMFLYFAKMERGSSEQEVFLKRKFLSGLEAPRVSQIRREKSQHDHKHEESTLRHAKLLKQQVENELSFLRKSRAGKKIIKHLELSFSEGRDAGQRYEQSLRLLKQNKRESAELIREQYLRSPELSFKSKFGLMYTLSQLGEEESLEFFVEQTDKSIELDENDLSHQRDDFRHAMILKTTSVQGLEQLAKQGIEQASVNLLRVAEEAQTLTVRREAIRAYLRTAQDQQLARQELKKRLPASEHKFIHLKKDDVREVQRVIANQF